MSSTESLLVHHAGAVTTLTLNRPEALNALDEALTTALIDALDHAEADDGVGAVVLTGAGRGFCAGADLSQIADALGAGSEGDGRPSTGAAHQLMRDGSMPLARRLLSLRTPMVTAVHGPCAGAGVALALAADVVLVGGDATFSVAFVRRGLVPDYGVTWLLPRLVGLRAARELCLLGETLDASAADRMGLITRVVAGDTLLDDAGEVAGRLAAGPQLAQRLTKQLLAGADQLDPQTAIEAEFAAQAVCFGTDDAAEGARAFLDERQPWFTGR